MALFEPSTVDLLWDEERVKDKGVDLIDLLGLDNFNPFDVNETTHSVISRRPAALLNGGQSAVQKAQPSPVNG